MKHHHLKLEAGANAQHASFVGARLREFDAQHISLPADCHKEGVELYLTNASGDVMAGLTGYTYWKALLITKLWVSAAIRHQGHGTRLLQEAELRARKQGCTHVLLETTTFNAPAFYQQRGYTLAGAVPNWPAGHEFQRWYKVLTTTKQPTTHDAHTATEAT